MRVMVIVKANEDRPVPVNLIARIVTVRARETEAGRHRARVRRT